MHFIISFSNLSTFCQGFFTRSMFASYAISVFLMSHRIARMLRQSFRQSIRRLQPRRTPSGSDQEVGLDVDFVGTLADHNSSSTRLFPVARSKGFSPTGPSPTHELELGAYAMSNLSAVAATATVICPDPPDYATVVIEQQPPRSPSLTSDVDTK